MMSFQIFSLATGSTADVTQTRSFWKREKWWIISERQDPGAKRQCQKPHSCSGHFLWPTDCWQGYVSHRSRHVVFVGLRVSALVCMKRLVNWCVRVTNCDDSRALVWLTQHTGVTYVVVLTELLVVWGEKKKFKGTNCFKGRGGRLKQNENKII